MCSSDLYPQWWWQPCDKWIISSANWTFEVEDVRLDKDWFVHHFWKISNWELQKWEKVELKIDKERRILNTKLHSAGHFIDYAIQSLGVDIKPTKWYHFPDGSYVEYQWEIQNSEELIPKLQQRLDEIIFSNVKAWTKELSNEEAVKQWIWAPEWKSARIVWFDWYDYYGCGGTHVSSSKEIWRIMIRKIKNKKWNSQISYTLDDID